MQCLHRAPIASLAFKVLLLRGEKTELCLLARAGTGERTHSPDKLAVWEHAGGELDGKPAGQTGCLLAGRDSRNAAGLFREKETLLSS